jgi:TPR repeat protein
MCAVAVAHRSLIVEEYMIYNTGMTSTSVFNQGVRHFHGLEGKEKNINLAVKYFRRAAKRGFPEALYQLGICYANGVGVEEVRDGLNEFSFYFNVTLKYFGNFCELRMKSRP